MDFFCHGKKRQFSVVIELFYWRKRFRDPCNCALQAIGISIYLTYIKIFPFTIILGKITASVVVLHVTHFCLVEFIQVLMLLTTKSCCKSFDLAPEGTKNHVSEGKAVEAGEGAHRGDEEVRHSQVHQNVVQMRPELLILSCTCDSKRIDGRTGHKQEEHKS